MHSLISKTLRTTTLRSGHYGLKELWYQRVDQGKIGLK